MISHRQKAQGGLSRSDKSAISLYNKQNVLLCSINVYDMSNTFVYKNINIKYVQESEATKRKRKM